MTRLAPIPEAAGPAAAAVSAAAAASTETHGAREYLMCPPSYFDVRYRINPWMFPDRPVDQLRAMRQWRGLHDTLCGLGHRVRLIDPQPGLPDMVFAANGGLVIGDRALVPRFRHAERAQESAHFRAAFDALGVRHVADAEYVNEGEGDFRLVGSRILAGTGPRSESNAAVEAAEFFGIPVVTLTLTDPRLYHLDTALGVLDVDTVVYWPDAFDRASRAVLAELYPDAVVAGAEDAAALALNVISDGSTVVLGDASDRLSDSIAERGFAIVRQPMDEFRKAGGGAKCCVLEWHRSVATGTSPSSQR